MSLQDNRTEEPDHRKTDNKYLRFSKIFRFLLLRKMQIDIGLMQILNLKNLRYLCLNIHSQNNLPQLSKNSGYGFLVLTALYTYSEHLRMNFLIAV